MPASRSCPVCGDSLQGKGPRARYCSAACRAKGHRAGLAPPVAALTSTEQPEPVDLDARRPATEDGEHPMVVRARERLRAADRLDTWEGQAALELAEQISTARVATLSARAAANKQLGEAMDRALRGADAAGSRVQEIQDEMAKRRARRAAQAAQAAQ